MKRVLSYIAIVFCVIFYSSVLAIGLGFLTFILKNDLLDNVGIFVFFIIGLIMLVTGLYFALMSLPTVISKNVTYSKYALRTKCLIAINYACMLFTLALIIFQFQIYFVVPQIFLLLANLFLHTDLIKNTQFVQNDV